MVVIYHFFYTLMVLQSLITENDNNSNNDIYDGTDNDNHDGRQ